jgi:hypothetical protein
MMTTGIFNNRPGDKYDSDCFTVIAQDENEDVAGRLYCTRNSEDPIKKELVNKNYSAYRMR